MVSSSQGVPEVPTAAGDSRISSITKETRCTELCDYASRRLFVTRASGAAQEKQLGEQKTFHKASRRGHSRAATGRGAGRAQCGNSTSTGGAERLHNNRLHQTCRPVNQLRHVCVERCPLTTRHTAARSGDSCGGTSADHTRELFMTTLTELWRDRDPEAEAVTRRSRADECTIAGSQAEQSLKRGAERRLRTDLRGKDSNDEAFPATYKSGPHVARRKPRPCRR